MQSILKFYSMKKKKHIIKLQLAGSYETSVIIQKSTYCRNSEEDNLEERKNKAVFVFY